MTTEVAQPQAAAPATQTASQPTPAATAQPQAFPAPAATPAAPAATTPAVAPAESAASADGPFGPATEYELSGNTNLDTALKWAGKIGLNLQTCSEMQEAEKGNFGPLRALLAEKQVPGAEAYLALAEAGVREMKAAAAERENAVKALVVEVAGGEAEWGEVFNWAAENADPAEKEQINAALAQGGFVAEAVAARLVNNYRAQANVSVAPQASVPAANASGAATAVSGPLSPQEYGKAVQDLRIQLKGRQIEGTAEYSALQRRRAAYRG